MHDLVRQRPDRTVVTGHLDAEGARELERELRRRALGGERTVVVDISGVETLEPALAGALLRAHRSLSWRNCRLIVVVTAAIRRTLERMGLDDALDLVESGHGGVAAGRA